jgi:hypothetical protein
MSNIHYYEKLIQEKRKKTPFRDFIMELGSWEWMNLYKRWARITRYPDTGRIKILDDDEYKNARSCTREYDDTKSFFENFRSFMDIFPFEHIFHFENNINSDFADGVFWAKDAYLSFIVWFHSENVAYSALCYNHVHNIFNSFLACNNCSNIYMSWGISESHNVFYSRYITNSHDIWFSTNLIGCQNCIGCDGLENQSYMIGNIQYSKEDYTLKKSEILRDKKSYKKIYSHIRTKKWKNYASENVSWDFIVKSSNIENGSWVVNIHDARNVVIANGANGSRYFYDGFDVGMNSEHFYAVMWAGTTNGGTHHLYCSLQITDCSWIYYSQYLQNCHHCLGCIGLKNASYCILNKQYTPEEWEILAGKIFASMESDSSLGDFFPGWMNPFYFNDTAAYLFDESFTREEVEAKWYLWRDEPIRSDIPEWVRIVRNTELDQFQGFRETPFVKGDVMKWQGDLASEQNPQSLRDSSFTKELTWYIDPEVMNIVISDENGNYYRIVKMEYDFLMKHSLPLPTIHWLDRIKAGLR